MPEGNRESGRAAERARSAAVLVVEDDEPCRIVLREVLRLAGYEVVEAASRAEAEMRLRTVRVSAAILDYQLPDGNALSLLESIQQAHPRTAVIILTAHSSVELAVEAMRRGADDFMTKPADPAALRTVLERCLDVRRMRRRKAGHDVDRDRRRPDPFLGTSQAIRALERLAHKVAATQRPVLLLGPTGSGKGVLARWIHENGLRAEEPFVELNCAGLHPELLTSELFGHARGAFTGATEARRGLLEVADRGTFMLDEIGDMDLAIQAKLLKVLEEQTFRRVGEVDERRVDVRLVAATHHDLGKLVEEGRFRSDLYFRVNTLTLEIPPLRERREDLPILVRYFAECLSREVGRPDLAFSAAAMENLVSYDWPGNIRELRNVLERAMLLGEGEVLDRGDLRFEPRPRAVPSAETVSGILSLSQEQLDKLHVERTLQRAQGSMSRAARMLGIQRSTLYFKVKKYGIAR